MRSQNWRMSTEQLEAIRQIPLYHNSMFECRQGWYELLYDLGAKISGYCKHNDIEMPRIQQIKEKFGTLRFYYNYQNRESIDSVHQEQIRNWVSEAEAISETTCENCGQTGELVVEDGVWKVVCAEHRAEHAMTSDQFKKAQEAAQKARRKCEVCGKAGVDQYFDGSQVKGYCDEHKQDFITAEEYYENWHLNAKNNK